MNQKLSSGAVAEEEAMASSLQPLPYGRQWLDEDDIRNVVEVLRGDWLTQGPAIEAFEKALTEYCGARYAVAVANGTAALHLACLAAGVGPGDVGITSPITFVASANCVAYCGGTPAFSDVDPETVTLDPVALEAACEQLRPKVIIPVDLTGQTADLPAIHRIAERFGALVIEDAAHSLGASYTDDGETYRVGSCAHAEMTILSFHPVKQITTGEGGAILTNDSALYERLQMLRTHGITRNPERLTRNDGPWYHELQELGFNYRITDLQCALGLSQMRKLDEFVERRRQLVDLYGALIKDLSPEVSLLTETAGRRSSYHLLVARVSGGSERRRRVFDSLHAQGIRAQVHYIPVHTQPFYMEHYGFRPGDFPVAEKYYEGCVSLPLFPRMTDADVERVVNALRTALAQS
jgi:UDP-4-amino-4,6-dideoxy-N-acetyl-beta-L-altrosamine transaminase